MKFGKHFKQQKVPEWTNAYMDYNGLKRILAEILQYKQTRQPSTPLRAAIQHKVNFAQTLQWTKPTIYQSLHGTTAVATTNPLKSSSRDTTSGVEDMNVEHGVEMSNNFQLEKSSYEQRGREHMELTSELDRTDCNQEESTHGSEVIEVQDKDHGFFCGCSIALLIAVVLRIQARKLVDKAEATASFIKKFYTRCGGQTTAPWKSLDILPYTMVSL
ncbi:PHOSPHATE TRANSPORTER PHO1-like protein 10 [Salix koriyanagi]|uniref:PHOSPHATE TRANSPORTER PHO1-like protein 10 n=1 Tax=Salix koriyanagi TaxID=2511006 RepID=A0A9Q0WJG8_9ROSI|nr:PHOSPHATE TRANSPORTER PHO1-like protein 10 [Salix koriyanagi]